MSDQYFAALRSSSALLSVAFEREARGQTYLAHLLREHAAAIVTEARRIGL
jgi:hypothetical protein